MPNPVVFFEIGARDRAASREFFSKLFDWRIEDTPHASRISPGEIPGKPGINGHINSLGHEPHNYVTIYVRVDDIEAHIQKAVELGGKKLVGPVPLSEKSAFAWIADLDGNIIGIYTD
jgi:predicted enzyme related to lactoylglutathione lyase